MMVSQSATLSVPGVDLYWIPLGAGASVVRANGWLLSTGEALLRHRSRRPIYHSALIAHSAAGSFVIEMTPETNDNGVNERGVVAQGRVGTRWLGRFRIFRYEIHRWQGGVIPDLATAIDGPIRVTNDAAITQLILDLVPRVPTPTWGRDELNTDSMWNSNSVTSWLLAKAHISEAAGNAPRNGVAPGWNAGLVVAQRPPSNRPDIARPDTSRHLARQILDVAHDIPVFFTTPLYRRWHLRWGATQAEVRAELEGDSFIAHPQFRATRAITIDAPPEVVWPWLVQVGCLRGGFYSNDLLDNLARPSADHIVAELQGLEVGQWVPMSPTPTERTALRVHSFDTNHWLLWTKSDSTWMWLLTPTTDGGTRLVTRIRAQYDWRHPASALFGMLLMEFGDFAMLRRMLRGIKTRAESALP